MSENVVTLSRTEGQTQTVLLKKMRKDAEALFVSADRAGNKLLRRSAAEVIGIASGELRNLEGWK